MRVCHYVEHLDRLKGGIRSSVRHQRKALDREGVDWTDDPAEDYDILHLNVPGARSFAHALRARREGVKVVVHSHVTGEDFRNSFRLSNVLAPFVDRYTTALYRRADHIVAPSAHTRAVLARKGIEGNVTVVSNGVDGERLDGFEAFEGDDGFTAINLGMVFERKGLSAFIAAGEKLPGMRFAWYGPRVNRLLAGWGVNRRIRRAPDNVEFPGFVEDVREAFAVGDVFFFPTQEENEGISLLEAMYCGVPPVIRDIPTYDGWLEHGTHCLKAESVEGFVAALERLQEDDGLREEVGRNARELAGEHTLDRVGEELRAVYERALDP